MKIEPKHIHVWSAELTLTAEQVQEKTNILSADELERANRFRFEKHKLRFIAARSNLREILSLYLHLPPQTIHFGYSDHHKPYVLNHAHLQFNLAHSHELAVYAFTLDHPIGIDIEKIEDNKDKLAERFFSKSEIIALKEKSAAERLICFYRLWSRKEALIKANGKGLSIPLSSFSVSAEDVVETISLEGETWTLLPLDIAPDYPSALACNQMIESVSYWKLFDHTPKLIKTSTISIQL